MPSPNGFLRKRVVTDRKSRAGGLGKRLCQVIQSLPESRWMATSCDCENDPEVGLGGRPHARKLPRYDKPPLIETMILLDYIILEGRSKLDFS